MSTHSKAQLFCFCNYRMQFCFLASSANCAVYYLRLLLVCKHGKRFSTEMKCQSYSNHLMSHEHQDVYSQQAAGLVFFLSLSLASTVCGLSFKLQKVKSAPLIKSAEGVEFSNNA
ncbi:hypothetical protein AMECASPLE_021508 [Ameca splendens]|uniref:Uncharacterized protein n=1 Tax=Ameca splendens TaxID=208324 RepID=A0ABV1A0D8_9TELE